MSHYDDVESGYYRRETLMEREPEPWSDTPMVAWVKGSPHQAAMQIGALQAAVRMMAKYWHQEQRHRDMSRRFPVPMGFFVCVEPDCRKLRDRLRPFGEEQEIRG